jgi:HKD family nuclease
MVHRAQAAVVGVAFVQRKGLKYLFGALKKLLDAEHPVELFTSGYLGITEVGALEDLLRLGREYPSLGVRFNMGDRFHAKFIYVSRPSQTYCLFVGSSNISVAGLAGLGEVNVQIRGSSTDSVGRSITVVVDNLRRDRTFRPLSAELIDEYRESLPGRRKRMRRKRRRAEGGQLPALQSLPVYVAHSQFTKAELKKIERVHPRWKWFVDWIGVLRALDRGQHFLEVDAVGRKRTFSVPKYLEHDRVPGVGMIAHVREGKFLPLAKLAARLGMSQGKLLDATRLDVYGIAILKRAFPKAFG